MHWPKEESAWLYENLPKKPEIKVLFDEDGNVKQFDWLMNSIEEEGNKDYICTQAQYLQKQMQSYIENLSDDDVESFEMYYRYDFASEDDV
jgi:uncharacterized protein YrzB (UPF0473 family)